MLCVECGTRVAHVYREFSPGNIRLTQCSHCHRCCDKYIEYELILILLDLILFRTSVYRHCLFNLQTPQTLRRAMMKLIPAYVCLETYIQWRRILRYYTQPPIDPIAQELMTRSIAESAASSSSSFFPPYDRHASIIALIVVTNVAYWCMIQLVAKIWQGEIREEKVKSDEDANSSSSAAASPSSAPSVSLFTSLLLSSFGKFFLLFPLIWSVEYQHIHIVAIGVKAFVYAANIQAVRVYLGSSVLRSTLLIGTGILAQLACCYLWYTFIDPTIAPHALWL